MATRFQIALSDINDLFDSQGPKTYNKPEISRILSENRLNWRLAKNMTTNKFIDALEEHSKLQITNINCRTKEFIRYSWEQVDPYQIALSLHKNSYLSHGSAVFLHKLTDQIPKLIYVNREQSPKPKSSGTLTQDGINRALSNRQRISNYQCSFNDSICLLLSGKHTRNLEVGTLIRSNNEKINVTNLERTLIDIAVRPIYAGGAFQVLEAYRSAINTLSLNTLIATLKRLDYRYPYHQVIGFYLSRAGMEPSKLERLKKIEIKFDFYIDYSLSEPDYDPEWRLFIPKSL